jgi:hypothetical protein
LFNQVESNVPNGDVHRTRSKLEAFEDFSTLKASDLKLRIEEMLRIKGIYVLFCSSYFRHVLASSRMHGTLFSSLLCVSIVWCIGTGVVLPILL